MNKDTTEYEKNLNELKEQILKEGNTLLTKRDLLERFCEIDKEYNGRPWNLLQILANINILIGQESCEDCINRSETIKYLNTNMTWYDEDGYITDSDEKLKAITDLINGVPPVQPKIKTGHWIKVPDEETMFCSECNCRLDDEQTYLPLNFCPNCGAKMVEPQA